MQSCGIPLTWFNSANVWSQALFSLSLFALGSASLKHTHSFLIDKKKAGIYVLSAAKIISGSTKLWHKFPFH